MMGDTSEIREMHSKATQTVQSHCIASKPDTGLVDRTKGIEHPVGRDKKSTIEPLMMSCEQNGSKNVHFSDGDLIQATNPEQCFMGMVLAMIKKMGHKAENCVWFQILASLLIVILAVLFSTPITLWPQHDVILHPEYWYEPICTIIFCICVLSAFNIGIECKYVLKIDMRSSLILQLRLLFSNSMGFLIPYVSVYLIWVCVMERRHPMPYIGELCLLIAQILKITLLWFLIPSRVIRDLGARRRVASYIVILLLRIGLHVKYKILSRLFIQIPVHTQWVVAFVLPMLKVLNSLFFTHLAFKMTGDRDLSLRLVMSSSVRILHSLEVTRLIASELTPTTAYILMGSECVPNLVCFIGIIKKRHIDNMARNEEEIDHALKRLALREFLEILIPAVYCISFIIAYHGPNASLLGNVKNGYWHYKEICDITIKLSRIAMFFSIDVYRCLIFSFILWYYSQLHMFKAYVYILRNFGILILFNLSAYNNHVMCYYHEGRLHVI